MPAVGGAIIAGVKLDGAKEVYSSLMNAGKRALVLEKRILESAGQQIAVRARRELLQIKNPERDPATRGKGPRRSLVNAITSDRTAKLRGDHVSVNVYWGLPHGKLLEDGPQRFFAWTIEAKIAKALRFATVGGGGAVTSVQYVARGYKVLHVWSPDHLRPHIEPAMTALWPGIWQQLKDVPRKVMSGALR